MEVLCTLQGRDLAIIDTHFTRFSHVLQKETVSGAEAENETVAVAQMQLENISKSMEMNSG